MKEEYNDDSYKRAKKRVESIKGFYWHFAIYLLVNTFILIKKYFQDSTTDEFWRWESFIVLILWGVGVVVHAFCIFGFEYIFGKEWEQKKIRQFMDEDAEDYRNKDYI
ncbi:hypothetical protein GWK08_11825 [Leptobacterium flavescens]|uniref:2TM domain-containing protein n=1 Tax=Leptobacterium flavescens TaxID=472055 RepID=A0A6P0UTE9_9FLAO|nr:2TM domain-containing protein [Leptobacterium flavescens]NER14133.1 hypothetical protein [Leptobacterium flavescens]